MKLELSRGVMTALANIDTSSAEAIHRSIEWLQKTRDARHSGGQYLTTDEYVLNSVLANLYACIGDYASAVDAATNAHEAAVSMSAPPFVAQASSTLALMERLHRAPDGPA